MANKGTESSTIPKGDPFRRDYGTLTAQQKIDMTSYKMLYENVWEGITRIEAKYGNTRDVARARSYLQDSCHWAIRAITRTGDQE